jgi:hypothetical protein
MYIFQIDVTEMDEEKKRGLSSLLQIRKEMRYLKKDIDRHLAEEENLVRHLHQAQGDSWVAFRKSRSELPPLYIFLGLNKTPKYKRSSPWALPVNDRTGSDLSMESVDGSREVGDEHSLTFAQYSEMDTECKKRLIQANVAFQNERAQSLLKGIAICGSVEGSLDTQEESMSC